MKFRHFCAIWPGVLLTACAQLPVAAPAASPAAAQLIPPLASTPASLPPAASQTLYAAYGGRDAALSCGMKAANGGWHAVCVNALGLRVLTMGVDGQGLLTAERGQGVPEVLDPARVLADVQLTLWPLASLQAAYAGTGWEVSEPIPATRRLRYQNKLFAEVHYGAGAPWAGQLWLSNFAYGYTLALITEADSPPPP